MAKSTKQLVIVESPTKAKTISRFLGNDFSVLSSFGHIRDLPKSKLGVDVEKNFEPQYIIPTKSKKTVSELKKTAKKAQTIILATDEDREGESIAWHLTYALDIPENKYQRIVFHEITPEAIKKALDNPRKIDTNLVHAQQARRVLDRLVGYKLSPLLWEKIRRGLSAGRVQSAALRLIVDREREIAAFKAQEYWSIEARLQKSDVPPSFLAQLSRIDNKAISKLEIKTQEQAREVVEGLNQATWSIVKVETKETKRSPAPPFTTSTLQQEANRRFGMSGKQIMVIAQQLYEGIELGGEGAVGLITYMRTDSVNISEQAIEEAKHVIRDTFGSNYVLKEGRRYKTKSKGAQEAHEAIRPTSIAKKPQDIKSYLDKNQFRLYELIWRRAVATQMPEAQFLSKAMDIDTGTKYGFRATGQTLTFDGFLKIYNEENKISQTQDLPKLSEGDKLDLQELTPNQHFTQPPPRFSDATLVKTLEQFGIGRPSTYAPTISTLIAREYIVREERKLKPTEIGEVVTDFLIKYFSEIVDYKFTAHMEDELDRVANGKIKWQPVVEEFYSPFAEKLSATQEKVEKVTEPIDQPCPVCGGPMVARYGRFGKFGACARYPECKGRISLNEEEKLLEEQAKNLKCPECSSPVVVRHGRFGIFLGCSRYPECKGIVKIEKKFGPCPECGQGEVVERRGGRGKRIFYGCSRYPECKYTNNKKPEPVPEG